MTERANKEISDDSRERWVPILACLVLSVALLTSCGKALPEQNIDLSERLSLVQGGSTENFQKHLEVIRRGVKRDSVQLVAPVIVRAPLRGFSGSWALQFWAAAVFNTGDGFLMMVFVRKSGVRYLIGNRYFDPGRKADDRNWIPIALRLDEIGSGDQLEIEVSGGPLGDLTADWLAVSGLTLKRISKTVGQYPSSQ